MFIIWGWGGKRHKNHRPAAIIKCNGCFEKGEWSLVEIYKSFSLFFIPIISYDNKYFLVCNNCSKSSFEIFGDDVKVAKDKVKLFKAFHRGAISQDELSIKLKNSRTKDIEAPDDNWECPKCNASN